MFSFIKNLFKDPTADWPRVVSDPVLGDLRLSEDATWWEGNTDSNGKKLGFKIGGEGKPDDQLIAKVHDIVRNMPEFEQKLSTFLAEESRSKHWAKFADEMRQLSIEDVCFFWPAKPEEAMIFFKGPDKFRLWHCDYAAGKLQGLAFDS